MQIINQNTTVWGETPTKQEKAILWIEKAGRVCYRSEDSIVEGSGIKFVGNIIKRKHWSVIEHSNFVIRTIEKVKWPVEELRIMQKVFNSPFMRYHIEHDHVYISGNFRAWMETMNLTTLDQLFELELPFNYQREIHQDEIPIDLRRVTVEFVTDRAVTHELVRHRADASYSQESQRYCKYGNLQFIEPSWASKYDNDSFEHETFAMACEEAEGAYGELIDLGLKAEEARVVLPNATATKIVMTTSIPHWELIFNLRTSAAAYPAIRDLINPVKQWFHDNNLID